MFKQLFCITTLLIAVSGCQSQPPVSSHVNLEGHWQVSKIANQTVKSFSPVLFDFNNGTLRGSNGCNHFEGEYTQYNNELSLSASSTTIKACVDSLIKQEQSFMQNLVLVTKVKIKSHSLQLISASNRVLFELTHTE